jgi:hypothetical protein
VSDLIAQLDQPRPMTAVLIGASALGAALLTQAPVLAHSGHAAGALIESAGIAILFGV